MAQIYENPFAFVFPGQGSQTMGMLCDFTEQDNTVIQAYSEASDLLGYDLWDIVQNGPESELNRTDITQPALLTAAVAIWRLWRNYHGNMPDYMAGHSLGEYSALVCSGSMKFSDAVILVRDRGIYMQKAVPTGEGAMAVIIGLESVIIEQICMKIIKQGSVFAANYNSPEQTVIAGQTDAVKQAMELAREAGARRVVLLPVTVPSHCLLMKSAAEKLAKRLVDIKIEDSPIPIVQNVDAKIHHDANDIKAALVRQLHQPVLWVDSITKLSDLGCKSIIESGPGKVLSGLIKRIHREINTINLHKFDSFVSAVKAGAHEH